MSTTMKNIEENKEGEASRKAQRCRRCGVQAALSEPRFPLSAPDKEPCLYWMIFGGWVGERGLEGWGGSRTARRHAAVEVSDVGRKKKTFKWKRSGATGVWFLKGCLFADGRQFLRAEPVNTPAEL